MPNIIQSGSVRFVQDIKYALRVGSITSGSSPGIFSQVGDDIKFDVPSDPGGATFGMDDVYDKSTHNDKAGVLFWDTYLEAQSEAKVTIVFTPTSNPTGTLPNSTSASMVIGVCASPTGRVEDIDFSSAAACPTHGGSFLLRPSTADQFKYNTFTGPTNGLAGGSTMGGPLNQVRISSNFVDDASDDRSGDCSIRGLRNNCLRNVNPVYTNKGSTTRTSMSRTSKIFVFLAAFRNSTSSDVATCTGRYEVTISLPAPKLPYDQYFGMGIIPFQG